MSAYYPPSLQAGDRVKGRHLFGNSFSGVISSVRPHSIDHERMVVFIAFDEPTDLGISPKVKTGDYQEGICTEVYPPKFKGDRLWQSGTGDEFEVIPPVAKLSERVRPDCEAAPWVVDAIKSLEQELGDAYTELNKQSRIVVGVYNHAVWARAKGWRSSAA